jgi:hypothetical protein
MSIAPEPEAPATIPPPIASLLSRAMIEPPPPAPPLPPSPTHQPVPTDSEPPLARRPRGVAGGLILIAIGAVALLGTWLPGGAAWLFIGIGVAFAVARVVTGRSGFGVPAGIVLGLGSYLWLMETGALSGPASGGAFFIFLGLGFLAAYAIAARPGAAWPVFPALVLIAFGVFIQATTLGTPFGQFWWLGQFWPLALVAVGAWLVVRDRIPESARTPVAVTGASALVLIGLLVAAAGMSTMSNSYAGIPMPMFRAWAPFGEPSVVDTVTLTAPGASIESLRVANTSGRTVIRPTDGPDVRVQATRHFWSAGNAPDVRLVPSGSALTIDAPQVGPGPFGYVDYTIDVPARMGAEIRSASGSIDIRGLAGPVRLETASGDIDARDLTSSVSATTASGAIRMTNVSGTTQARTASGEISASGVERMTEARSISGSINLDGAFTDGAQIASVSGSVSARFIRAAAVHIDANSFSGDVSAGGLGLINQASGPHSVAGDLNGGGPTVSIRTTSGEIQLVRGF